MLNEDIAKGKWTHLKGEIQKAWGNVTGDELEKTKGDMKSIAGLIQEKYGLAKEEATLKLSELSDRCSRVVAEATEKTKEALKSNDKKQH